ncbi:VCBS repeat-containing protein [Paenarthrobacter sp. CC6]|uniref:FG-GAP repeat domain-containing protein n=1 Tax=Paenarthrobacter sp. CC6 TaxID=3029184 RepID=UPI00339BBCCB
MALILTPAAAAGASAPTVAVAQLPAVSAPLRTVWLNAVEIQGDPTLGGRLHMILYSPPEVTPAGGQPTFTYKWTRDNVVIPGANQAFYSPVAADVGHTLSGSITATFDATSSATQNVHNPTVIGAKARSWGFNGDGTADVFARNAYGQLLLYPTDGRGHWYAPQVIGTGWHIYDLLLSPGDFDGDGNVDVMARDPQGRLFLYSGNGAGGWIVAKQVGQGWQGFRDVIGAGDFNGDGTNDIIARDSANNLLLYPGDGRGGWLSPTQIGFGWGNASLLTAVGYFTGSEALSLVYKNQYNGLMISEGPRNGQLVGAATTGYGWQVMSRLGGLGDFNGDGDPDIYGIDYNGQMVMYYGNGAAYQINSMFGSYWKGQATVGTGWNVMNYVF